MKPYQFDALDAIQKAEAIWARTHIGDRQDDQHNILLYQIDGFYVEVYYHKNLNAIVRFRSFSNPDQLSHYLRKIDINELINWKRIFEIRYS